ncbi:MAG: ATP-binding cassette domain-containing protein [Planctomycetes bacterium]|nr:ATP-binding cassette domain-containing protein [Planctomycetota bacterium]
MDDALVLNEVTKRFGTFTAVDRLSVRMPRGEIIGFLGPNGAGKTTTIRMLMSITYPDEGSMEVLGRPRAIDVKDRIGYLPEERGLYRKMTVDHTLRYFGQLKGMPAAALKSRIGELLESVGLSNWRRHTTESLSKGMQQKIQFIATILHDPELVVLDEPFSGLDPLNRDLLETLLRDLKRRGKTVLFSTHQLEQAERLCDRILLIHRGRKLVDGTIEDVRSRFAARKLVLSGEGDFEQLRRSPGVVDEHVTVGGAWLELDATADPQAVLRRAMEIAKLTQFEIARPTLQEIFVRLVGQDEAAAVLPPTEATR